MLIEERSEVTKMPPEPAAAAAAAAAAATLQLGMNKQPQLWPSQQPVCSSSRSSKTNGGKSWLCSVALFRGKKGEKLDYSARKK